VVHLQGLNEIHEANDQSIEMDKDTLERRLNLRAEQGRVNYTRRVAGGTAKKHLPFFCEYYEYQKFV